MKRFLSILAAFIVGGMLIGALVHAHHRATHREAADRLQQQHAAEKQKLVRDQKHQTARIQQQFHGRLNRIQDQLRDPDQIIADLAGLKPGPSLQLQRQLVVLIEELFQQGEAALPAIGQFLKQKKEADYGFEYNFFRDPAALDFPVPPSLRLGLFNVLLRLGGNSAEAILLRELNESARSLEILYLTLALEKLSPGRHREIILANAKTLLRNPPKSEEKSRFDRNAKVILYAILKKYGDTTFTSEARKNLVNENGLVQEEALDYLRTVQGAAVMPTIREVLRHPKLTKLNPAHKIPLFLATFDNLGRHPVADDIIAEEFRLALRMYQQSKLVEDRDQGLRLMEYFLGKIVTLPTKPKLDQVRHRLKLIDRLKAQDTDLKARDNITRAEPVLKYWESILSKP